MARLSQAFLSNLGRPAMTQSLFDLGTAIGNVPNQYAEAKKAEAFAQYDVTTPQGMLDALNAELKTTKDPARRREIGAEIIALRKQVATAASDQATANANLLAQEALNAYASTIEAAHPNIAALVRTGEMTPTSAMSRIESINQNKDKKARVEKTVAALNKAGHGEIAQGYEDGIYTQAQISELIKDKAKGNYTDYSNRKRQVVDGNVVWVADVKPPNGEKFIGYMEGGKWVPLGDKKVEDLPKEVAKRAGSVSGVDLDNAALELSRSEDYNKLGPLEKEQLQLAVAARAQKYVDEGVSYEDALEKAVGEIPVPPKEVGGLEAWWNGLFADEKPSDDDKPSDVRREADKILSGEG